MPAMNPQLRVGLLMDSMHVELWELEMLRKIAEGDAAEIALVVLNDAPRPDRAGLWNKIGRNFSTRVFRAWGKVEKLLMKVGGRGSRDAFVAADASELLEGVPVIRERPRRTKFTDRFSPETCAAIREREIDVLVRLGFRILKGDILKAPRYGVWSYHHGDNTVNRGGAPGFWEVYRRQPLTGSILQILTEDLDNGYVLERSWSATDPLLVRRSMNNYYWKTLSFLPRKLAELRSLGEDEFFRRADRLNLHPPLYSERLYKLPANGEFLRLFVAHWWRYLRSKVRGSYSFTQWILLFRPGQARGTSFWRFRKILPPRDRFWADPFVMEREDRFWIFIEELPYATNKGHISVIEMDAKGRWKRPVKVLERPYHLSYPFLFEHEGELYMLPETLDARRIEAYRCVEFPHRWEPSATLMEDVAAVDATLYRHGDRWWLFAAMIENEGASALDELFLFHADSPLSGQWTPHPLNPVVSDVRRARPGGAIFEHEGRLYRPAQDCSGGYGTGMRLMWIRRLDPEGYEEEEAGRIEPHWERRLEGVHTYNHVPGMTVIDAKWRRARWGK